MHFDGVVNKIVGVWCLHCVCLMYMFIPDSILF